MMQTMACNGQARDSLVDARNGFYFGSFNPLTEGHVNTALQAARFLNLEQVTLVPNLNRPGKEAKMTSLSMRIRMVAEHPLIGFSTSSGLSSTQASLCVCSPVLHGRSIPTDWAGRTTLMRAQSVSDSKLPPVLLLGQDSFDRALQNKHSCIAMEKFPFDIYVLPRTVNGLHSVPLIPSRLANKVFVIPARDKIEISSSMVRERLQQGVAPLRSEIHPDIFKFILANQLYLPHGSEQGRSQYLIVMGAPGTGKSTVAALIAQNLTNSGLGADHFSPGHWLREWTTHRSYASVQSSHYNRGSLTRLFLSCAVKKAFEFSVACTFIIECKDVEDVTRIRNANPEALCVGALFLSCDATMSVSRMGNRSRAGETIQKATRRVEQFKRSEAFLLNAIHNQRLIVLHDDTTHQPAERVAARASEYCKQFRNPLHAPCPLNVPLNVSHLVNETVQVFNSVVCHNPKSNMVEPPKTPLRQTTLLSHGIAKPHKPRHLRF
jgi:cytidyltransferase-like protein